MNKYQKIINEIVKTDCKNPKLKHMMAAITYRHAKIVIRKTFRRNRDTSYDHYVEFKRLHQYLRDLQIKGDK